MGLMGRRWVWAMFCVGVVVGCSYWSMNTLTEPTMPESPANDEEALISAALRRAARPPLSHTVRRRPRQ
jgi:hypothetical protein